MEFFGIGMGEFVALVVLATLFFGPEKLPDFARKAARVVNYLRNIANDATTQLKSELGPEYQDLTLSDLNPKTFLQKTLLNDVQDDLDEIKSELQGVRTDLASANQDVIQAGNSAREAARDTDSGVAAANAGAAAALANVAGSLSDVQDKLELAGSAVAGQVPFDAEAT